MTSKAQLHLLEPQHVTLPAPVSPPVDALPVLSGYRCTAAACQHLTVSYKRMERQWSESPPSRWLCTSFVHFARPVKLQMFFRGTKFRYLKVASPTVLLVNPDDNGDKEEDPTAITATPPTPPHVLSSPRTTHGPYSTDLDLETLTYFHHFTTVTSLTLPGDQDSQIRKLHGQMHVVSEHYGGIG